MPRNNSGQNSPFVVCDCTLISSMEGLEPAINLRELLQRLRSCSIESLFHHYCETVLRPSFDDPDFPNDFAVWAGRVLRDRALGERLGAVNPYSFSDFEQLREATRDIIDERLSELNMIPWALPGQEFQFMRAITAVFDTGMTIKTPDDLPDMLPKLTLSSIYFHFVEAHRRVPDGRDDFSAWAAGFGKKYAPLVDALISIDFYFLTLPQLKRELVEKVQTAIRSCK